MPARHAEGRVTKDVGATRLLLYMMYIGLQRIHSNNTSPQCRRSQIDQQTIFMRKRCHVI